MCAVNQHPARLANGLRSEARATAVCCADIERDACDRDRGIALAAPQSKKSRRDGEGGRIARHAIQPRSNFLPRGLNELAVALADGGGKSRAEAARR